MEEQGTEIANAAEGAVDAEGTESAASAKTKRSTVFKALRVALFLFLAGAMICGLSILVTPRFSYDAGNSVRGLYEEPRGSVQVVALGPSSTHRAFSADYLYEKYGIYAHNCGASSERPLASYYLLREMLRTQGDSISLVLLDVGPLVDDRTDEIIANATAKVYLNMEPSLNKLQFLWDFTHEYDDANFIEQLIPLLGYHSRWNELALKANSDATKRAEGTMDIYNSFMHGQALDWDSYASNASRGHSGEYTRKKNETITDEVDKEASYYDEKRSEVNTRYFEKIVELCQEEGIDLLLWRPPSVIWGNDEHDSATLISKQYGIPLLDMSMVPVMDECDLSYDLDYFDRRHANLRGSQKITDYLGKYLVDNYSFEESGADASAASEDDFSKYDKAVEGLQLEASLTIEDYLDALDSDHYVVFVAAKGESAEGLSDEAREKAAKLGFDKLARLKSNSPYVGIRVGEECLVEKTGDKGESVSVSGQFKEGQVIVEDMKLQNGAQIESALELASDAGSSAGTASISVWGNEKADNGAGINFVVYDKDTGLRISSASFDTHGGSRRSSDADLVADLEARQAENGA